MTLMIIDYNRTLYDPETDSLVPGAVELLRALRLRSMSLVLVSRKDEWRSARLSELGIAHFFSETLFVAEKTEQLFKAIRARYPGEFCYVLGDYLHQEIRAGNLALAVTIHFKRGKFADCEPQGLEDIPDVVISNLEDVLAHLTV